jgi:hypothetical protein
MNLNSKIEMEHTSYDTFHDSSDMVFCAGEKKSGILKISWTWIVTLKEVSKRPLISYCTVLLCLLSMWLATLCYVGLLMWLLLYLSSIFSSQISARSSIRAVHFITRGQPLGFTQTFYVHFFLLVNIFLMMCIPLERYVMKALWYQSNRSIRKSNWLSIAAWVLSANVTLLKMLKVK